MSKALGNLYWHDGKLAGIAFGMDKKGASSLNLSAELYENEQAQGREPYNIACEGVGNFNCTLDASELKDNLRAGNISNGYLKGDTLWVYFSDGILKVSARRFRVVKC